MPRTVVSRAHFSVLSVLPAHTTALHLSLGMEYGVTSNFLYIRSAPSRDRLMVLSEGHQGITEEADIANTQRILRRLVEHGCDVLLFALPLVSPNNVPVVALPRFGTIRLRQQNMLALLDNDTFSSLRFFVDPNSSRNKLRAVTASISAHWYYGGIGRRLGRRFVCRARYTC